MSTTPIPAAPVWRGWLLVALGVALAAGAMTGSAHIGGILPTSSPMAAAAVFYLIVFAPLIIGAILFGWLEGIAPWSVGQRPAIWLPVGFALGLGGFAAALGYSYLSGGVVQGAGAGVGGAVLIGAMLLTVFQTGSEELFFRGWLLKSFAAKTGIIGGVLLSSLLFSAFHILGGARGPVTLVNLLLGGVWFALLAYRSGGILAPLSAHAAWNTFEDTILGMVPNPGVGEFGSVVDLDLVGPSYWGGTVEGMNTSIGMTIVLVALIVPLIWVPDVTKRPSAPAPRRPGPAI